MNRFAIAILAAFTLGAAPAAALEAQLRPNVIVDGDYVKLSDLFDNAGDRADTVIAKAPPPGRRVNVDADWLQRQANAYGVKWRPASSFDHAVVERTGVSVTHEQIEQSLHDALVRQNVPTSSEIELGNRSTELMLPVGSDTSIGIRDLSYDQRFHRFSATIEVPANSTNPQRLRVSGKVFEMVDVPVMSHALNRGEVITARDLSFNHLRQEGLRPDVLTDADRLIGMSPRQGLRSGQMVSANDIERPVAVARGALVTMVLKLGTMTLTAQGRAVEPGSVGDTIRVANTHSNQTVEAKIESPNLVSVALSGGIALAN